MKFATYTHGSFHHAKRLRWNTPWGLFHPCWSILHFERCRLTSSQAANIGRGSWEPYYHLTVKERKKERKRKGQLGTIKLLSWKGQTHCESIYRQSYLAFTRGWFHYLNVWPPYHTIATPTLVPREKEKEREEEENNSTWKFLEVGLYSIAVYVLVMWCYILPNSDNHTRSILKLKYRLNQTLLESLHKEVPRGCYNYMSTPYEPSNLYMYKAV